MKYLSVEEVLLIHEYQLRQFGGTDGILDLNLLESAIYRPKTSFGGSEKYKSIFDKAACLLHSLIKNHPFVDGNKRTSLVVAIVFLKINGYILDASQQNLVDFVLKIESNKLNVTDISVVLEKLCQ